MALIKCPECGREISDKAFACPNCGSPVPQKMIPVHIERGSTIYIAVQCVVYIDGSIVGELKSGAYLDITLPVGTHSVSTESSVRMLGMSTSATRGIRGMQFEIKSTTRSVDIRIKTKPSWTGGTGKCVVDSVDVNNYE